MNEAVQYGAFGWNNSIARMLSCARHDDSGPPCRFLIGALKGFIAHSAVGGEFLGIVVLPLASNATDHASAVILAFRDKMDLAFG